MTYFFHLRRQCLLRAARDLPYELVELALAKNTIAFTLKLKWRGTWNDWLAHWAGRAVRRSAHCGTSLTHVHRSR